MQQLPANDFQRLQQGRIQALQDGRGIWADGYTAVMLVRRAGWSPQQTADFLNCELDGVIQWLHLYDTNGIQALQETTRHSLAPLSYRI